MNDHILTFKTMPQNCVFLKFSLADTFTCPMLGSLADTDISSSSWISGDVSSRFQSQRWFCLIHIIEINVIYIPWDPYLVLHIANLLMVSIDRSMLPPTCTLSKPWFGIEPQPLAKEPRALPLCYTSFSCLQMYLLQKNFFSLSIVYKYVLVGHMISSGISNIVE